MSPFPSRSSISTSRSGRRTRPPPSSPASRGDAGRCRLHSRRRPPTVAAVLDSGKRLTTVFVSHADPDFYFGAEVIADAFPDAAFVATPSSSSDPATVRGQAEGMGGPRREPAHPPGGTRAADGDARRSKASASSSRAASGGAARPPLPLAAPSAARSSAAYCSSSDEHVWIADTATPERRAAWIDLLDEMAALKPELVVPGHRLPGTAADARAIRYTRDYLHAFETNSARRPTVPPLTDALVSATPTPAC